MTSALALTIISWLVILRLLPCSRSTLVCVVLAKDATHEFSVEYVYIYHNTDHHSNHHRSLPSTSVYGELNRQELNQTLIIVVSVVLITLISVGVGIVVISGKYCQM